MIVVYLNIKPLKLTNMETTNHTEKFLFQTWVNCRQDAIKLYKGSDGKIYGKRFGLPYEYITDAFAMQLAWFHINRTDGFPCQDGRVSISQEAQDLQCKLMLN